MKTRIGLATFLAALNANAQEVTVSGSTEVDVASDHETGEDLEGTAEAETELNTGEDVLKDFRAKADYTFSTRTSNKRGSEEDKTTDRHSPSVGFDYQANRRLNLGLDASLNFVARKDNSTGENSDYTSFTAEPKFALHTDPFSLAFRMAYLSRDSQLFEIEGKKEPSLAGNLDAILRLGEQLRLRAGLSGRKVIDSPLTHSTIYGGLGLAVRDDFSLDGGVAHERDAFYGQEISYGVLGAESRENTSARAEMLVGKRFGVGLAVRTPIAEKLALIFRGSTYSDGGDVRKVNNVAVTVGLVGRR